MVSHLSDSEVTDFDYSSYEQKLRAITSVHLDHITDLHSSIGFNIEDSFQEFSKSYFLKIEQLLKEIKEV